MRPRQFADTCINYLNNALLRHWLDLQNSCLLDILKTVSSQQCLGDTFGIPLRCLFKMSNQRFCETLFRFAKKLPFRHPENNFARCLAVLTRQLLDILQMSVTSLRKVIFWNHWIKISISCIQPYHQVILFNSF